MIYSEPKFLDGGDRYLLIEFGNEMNLDLNFIAQGLATAILEQKISGIIETAPCFASMLVHYEPNEISKNDLIRELQSLINQLGPTDEIELKSRSYVNRYLSSKIEIGSVLFDRKRQIRWAGFQGLKQINSLGLILK